MNILSRLVSVLLMLSIISCGGSGDESDGGSTPAVVPSSNASLSGISLSVGNLDQSFQSDLFSYTASVSFSISSISVVATSINSNASITIQGIAVLSGVSSNPINLVDGFNVVSIEVNSEDGAATQVYSIDVTRNNASSFVQTAYIKALVVGEDTFSRSIAISGDTVVIGADNEASSATGGASDDSAIRAGAVYVFIRSAGVWIQQAFLKASNAESTDLFGFSVSIDNDTLVVGAPLESSSSTGGELDNSVFGAGAVYVFTRSAGIWTQQAFLKASNTGVSDFFGRSVAIQGNTLVAGALLEDGVVNDSGAATIFTRSAGAWTEQAYLKASDPQDAGYFGHSVMVDGDTVAIGANRTDTIEGAVYVFTRNMGTWNEQQKLKASNPDSLDFFGASIALSGNTIVVGAAGEDSSVTSNGADTLDKQNSGAAYIYTRNAGNWTEQVLLKASNVDSDDNFGESVAIDGDTILVGANGEASSVAEGQADNSAVNTGAVYVFSQNIDVWSQQGFLKAANAEENDHFGNAVAISGTTIIVGAIGEASNSSTNDADNSINNAGAVYVWQ